MTRTLIASALMAFSLPVMFAQTTFEVASVAPCEPGTPAPPMEHAGIADFVLPGGRFTARATTVEFLLEWAYGIQPSQHSGGPSWLGTDRFDIVAKAAGSATEDEMKQMVQALLAERFQLKIHHERREVSAYVVSTGKDGPKLFPSKDGESHGLRFAPHTSQDQKSPSYRIMATRYTLRQLTDTFGRQLGRVMVNNTGLDGEFDFSFDLTPDEGTPNPMDATLLMRAMREQLGLTVTSQKAAVEFYAIDSAEKAVAGN